MSQTSTLYPGCDYGLPAPFRVERLAPPKQKPTRQCRDPKGGICSTWLGKSWQALHDWEKQSPKVPNPTARPSHSASFWHLRWKTGGSSAQLPHELLRQGGLSSRWLWRGSSKPGEAVPEAHVPEHGPSWPSLSCLYMLVLVSVVTHGSFTKSWHSRTCLKRTYIHTCRAPLPCERSAMPARGLTVSHLHRGIEKTAAKLRLHARTRTAIETCPLDSDSTPQEQFSTTRKHSCPAPRLLLWPWAGCGAQLEPTCTANTGTITLWPRCEDPTVGLLTSTDRERSLARISLGLALLISRF